jgi:rhamnogalacturonyl hydrolase YesR
MKLLFLSILILLAALPGWGAEPTSPAAVAKTNAVEADLTSWPPGCSPRDIGERVARNFLERTNMLTPQDGTIHYSQVCTWYGALTFARLAGDQPLQTSLVQRYRELMAPENESLVPRREHVDYSVFGILPLEVYLQTKDANALALGKAKADTQWEKPRPDGLSPQTRFWIDDMYMISALQAQAFRATRDPVYLDRAAQEMTAYLDKLQQTNGLFFHGDRGKFFWGRGNGWMAAGMTELLRELPAGHPRRERILEGYRKMMTALVEHQDAQGLWHQLVDDPAAWPETSGSGMFTFALITGTRNGWLEPQTCGAAARRGWLALAGCLDDHGNVRNVCAGMGQRPDAAGYLKARQATGDFHGQAPLLWCASAWLRPTAALPDAKPAAPRPTGRAG